MDKLLLPYAYDSAGNLVHINNAHKEEVYKCPECGKVLSLNISKIPEGQKYHRRNHFSHPKGSPDNHCTESFLHRLFKEKAAEYIQAKIANGDKELQFSWVCHECSELHQGNMLRKTKSVCIEYDLGICRPDIALLDSSGNVIIVIEIVVTHKPTPEAIAFYNKHKIACLQINVSSFEDCFYVEEKLTRPYYVNICPTPICKKCGKKMSKPKMIFINCTCWNCSEKMKVAILETDSYERIYSPEYFTEEEVKLANENGAYVKMNYSKTIKKSYLSNTCMHCNTFIGKNYMHKYFYFRHEKEIELKYKCIHCIEEERHKEIEAQWEMNRKIDQKIRENGIKYCPQCGKMLILRKGNDGYFYGCKNYPKCHYTENFQLDE